MRGGKWSCNDWPDGWMSDIMEKGEAVRGGRDVSCRSGGGKDVRDLETVVKCQETSVMT